MDCCEREYSQCLAHPQCAHLEGECCPTTSGVFLDCCRNDGTSQDMEYPPETPDVESCSANSLCTNLEGDCCPTDELVFLNCCDNTRDSCASHPKCEMANLTGDCCPTTDGVFLDCCEKDFSQCKLYPKCGT